MSDFFDPNKPVQTRNGRRVRIVGTDVVGKYPIFALITSEDGTYEYPRLFCKDGRSILNRESDHDLINVPEKRSIFVNVYPDTLTAYSSRKDADYSAFPNRIKCIQVDFMV